MSPSKRTVPAARWGITAEELRRRDEQPAQPTKPEERICPECGSRVTMTESGREVGHANGWNEEMCPEHPDSDAEKSGQTSIEEW